MPAGVLGAQAGTGQTEQEDALGAGTILREPGLEIQQGPGASQLEPRQPHWEQCLQMSPPGPGAWWLPGALCLLSGPCRGSWQRPAGIQQ